MHCQANAALAKAQDDMKSMRSRLADARAAKEDLQRELDLALYEANMVADEYHVVCWSSKHASFVVCFRTTAPCLRVVIRLFWIAMRE